MTDFQDKVGYFIRGHETLSSIPHIYVFNNRINDTLVLLIKKRHKLKFQTFEAIKLFRSTKNTNRQNVKWRKRTKS